MCGHCGIREKHLPGWRHCWQCYTTVQTRFIDFGCDKPNQCPHLIIPLGGPRKI